MIELRDLYDDPDNPRVIQATNAEDDGLIASIREQGLILPLAVRMVDVEDGRPGYPPVKSWAVIDGQRRLMALRAIHGPKSKQLVPCRVLTASDTDTQLLQLSANMQRSDMNPLDVANAIARLVMKKVGTDAIAAATNKKRRWVQEMASVGKHLHGEAEEALQNGRISISQAIALSARKENPDVQGVTLRAIVEGGFNEDAIRALTAGEKSQAPAEDDRQIDIEDVLAGNTDEEIERRSPKSIGGWKTWKNSHGYLKWQMLKFDDREEFVVETVVQWRRAGSVHAGWGTIARPLKSSPAEAFAVAMVDVWSEFDMFAVKEDKATLLTALLPWINKGMRALGGYDQELGWRLSSKIEKFVQDKFAPPAKQSKLEASKAVVTEQIERLQQKAAALKKEEAKPVTLEALKAIPAWVAAMRHTHFVVMTDKSATLCKGWEQMAEVMHAAFCDQQYLLREFGTRLAWGNDGDGQPFDFHGVAYRVTDICKGALK
jgi:ParB/RepB/Spo0J family partition protein